MDSYFANLEKKKNKSKKNALDPNKLLEKMTRDSKKEVKKMESTTLETSKKNVVNDVNEEWELIEDEEKEIDLQNLRINNLVLSEKEEQTLAEAKEKESKENNGIDGFGEKQVWCNKKLDDDEESVDAPAPEPVEPVKPKAFVPIYLRVGATSGNLRISAAAIKPKLDSVEDFPSLGSAQEIAVAQQAEKVRQRAEAAILADTSQGEWCKVGITGGTSGSNTPFRPSGVRNEMSSATPTAPPSLSFKLTDEQRAAILARRQEQEAQYQSSANAAASRLEQLQHSSMPTASETSETGQSSRSGGSTWTRGTPRTPGAGGLSSQAQSGNGDVSATPRWTRGTTLQSNPVSITSYKKPELNSNRDLGTSNQKPSFQISQTNRFAALEELN